MTTPDPIDNEQLYNSIVLGGKRSPGVVKLSGHDREIDWDVKVGPGTSGATTTLKAEKPVEFSATFYLVRDDSLDANDFEDWEDFQKLIESTVKTNKAKALDIYHPDLARNGIKSVVMKSISGITHDGKGGQTVTVKFLEYRPPKPKPLTPLGSNTKPDPDAEALAQLAQLTAVYQKTPWG